MRSKRIAAWAVVSLLVALAFAVAASAADQHSGTWKLNLGKSKYSPGPGPKDATLTIESDENNFKVTLDGIGPDGKPTHLEYSAKFDGKDYPITGISEADAVSVKRIDANTVESTSKKSGQVVMTVTSVVSKDGKTRTSTFKGKDAQGREVHNVVVYDKQ